MGEPIEELILRRLDKIEAKQDAHREEFLREITTIKTEKKVRAGIIGGVWGLLSGGILVLVKILIDAFSKHN